MSQFLMRWTNTLLLPLFVVIGCGKKNPVSEVSLAESGVSIAETEVPKSDTGWTGWRGPTGNGIASGPAPVQSWDEQSNIRWRTEIAGRGHSSPIIVGDRVYLATADDTKQEQRVLAFDRGDGNEVWNRVIHSGGFPSAGEVHRKATNANGTLVSDHQKLFTAFLNSDAVIATALDLDGEIVWQREIGKFVSKFGYAPSPVLYRSLVIFAADNQGGGYLAALDAATGKIAWRVARGNASSYSSPHLATLDGRDHLLIAGGGAVTSYDPATGAQIWRTECIAEATCGTIVTSGNRVYAAGGYPDKETVCLASEDGKIVWSNRTKVYEPSPIVVGSNLVAINDDGMAFAWDLESGDSKWKRRLGGNFSASPIQHDGTVYASNLEGDTFVFSAVDEYRQIAKNRLGDDCYASPALVDGALYLRIGVGKGTARKEQLVCIAAPDLATPEGGETEATDAEELP